MKVNVFAKHISGKNASGKPYDFYNYIGQLTKKSGEVITVRVKFPMTIEAPKPELCPVTLVFDKKHANLETESWERENPETGEVEYGQSYNLWVSQYTTEEYIDESLNDFDD